MILEQAYVFFSLKNKEKLNSELKLTNNLEYYNPNALFKSSI